MGRRFGGGKLVLATHNKGKAREIAALLGPRGVEIVTMAELNLPEPEEIEETFIGNAVLKARAASLASGLPALADDSGVAVSALNGLPGIYSARWAGPGKDFGLAMARVERELGDAPDRSAAFICALALCWPDGHVETVEGRLDGALTFPPRGSNGFGYDPIFVPEGETRTFAEMADAEKQGVSHRGRAFAALVQKCFLM